MTTAPFTDEGVPTLEDVAIDASVDDPTRPDGAFLVIHGIGNQRPGETLVTVADALTRATDHWLRFRSSARRPVWERVALPDDGHGDPRARVFSACLDPPADDDPPECTIQIVERDRVTCLLGAEAYWADAFHTPQYVELLRWSILVVPWAVVEHFLRRLHKIRRMHGGERDDITQDEARGWPIVRELFVLLVATLLAPVFVGLLGAAWVLSWIPFEVTRATSRQVISALSATLGDSYVLLGSPARSAAIVERVTRQARALSHQVPPGERVWIIAHSQGCAVARAALLRLRADYPDDETLCRRYGLITVGSGLRKLSALRALDHTTNPVWLVAIFVCTSVFIVAAALLTVRQWAEPGYLASGIGGNLAILIVFVGSMLGSNERVAQARWRDAMLRVWWLTVAVGVIGGAVTIGFGWWYARDLSSHALALVATVASTIAGGGLAASHLLIGWQAAEHPDALDQIACLEWHDFWASHDPVPNGPIDVDALRPSWSPGTDATRTSTQVLNRASLLADHTSYFRNVEQVVLPIAHLLLGGRLIERDERSQFGDAVRRRTRFVIDRRIGMWLVLGSALWLMLAQVDRVLGWVPPWPDALGAIVSTEVAAPWLRVAMLLAPPLLALALLVAAWRLELGLRVLCVLRRHQLRWWRLTVATIVLCTGAAMAGVVWMPAPTRIEPLAIEHASATLRTLLAGPPPTRRTPPGPPVPDVRP